MNYTMNRIVIFALATIALQGNAFASTGTANANAVVWAQDLFTDTFSQTVEGFGETHEQVHSGFAFAQIGQSNEGAPFVNLGATSSNTKDGLGAAHGELDYSWTILSEDPSDETPVLVHISSYGFIASTYQTYGDGIHSTPHPNSANASIILTLSNKKSNGLFDTKSYGLEYGQINEGVGRITDSTNTTNNLATTNAFGEFSRIIDVYAIPNKSNEIRLAATATFNPGYFFNDFTREAYSIQAFIDPKITIDSAFASKYRLEVSEIPVVAVPEPQAIIMCAAGMSLLFALRFRIKPQRICDNLTAS
jgi:hypothetical protein